MSSRSRCRALDRAALHALIRNTIKGVQDFKDNTITSVCKAFSHCPINFIFAKHNKVLWLFAIIIIIFLSKLWKFMCSCVWLPRNCKKGRKKWSTEKGKIIILSLTHIIVCKNRRLKTLFFLRIFLQSDNPCKNYFITLKVRPIGFWAYGLYSLLWANLWLYPFVFLPSKIVEKKLFIHLSISQGLYNIYLKQRKITTWPMLFFLKLGG